MPDFNPSGCQKGVSWHKLLTGKERVLKPLKRAGERGEGKWQEVSWDQALTEIADHIIDAVQEQGPESIIRIGEPAEGGTQSLIYGSAVVNHIGGTVTDVQAEINDFSPGHLHHVRQVRPGRQLRRLVPHGPDALLADQPRLHLHPVAPLHLRGPLPRRRGRRDRAGLQPDGAARRLLRAGAHRRRRRARELPCARC